MRIILALLLLIAFSCPSAAQARLALVVGNAAYPHAIGELTNPSNDIDLVKDALETLGFTITRVSDTKRLDLYRAIDVHVKSLGVAGKDAIGFFYYSGHGAADAERKEDFLIPVDAGDFDAVFHQSVPLHYILKELSSRAPQSRNFVAFDACRNELKLKSKTVTKGFTVQSLSGDGDMVIAFASSPGLPASDAGARGGPYSNALSREIVKPLYHTDIFQNIREAVLKATSDRQKPWEHNGMGQRICLHPTCQTVTPVTGRPGGPTSSGAAPTSPVSASEEVERKAAQIREERARLAAVKWMAQSNFPKYPSADKLAGGLGDIPEIAAEAIRSQSSEKLDVRVLPPGALVSPADAPAAVSKGTIDAAFTWPGSLSRTNTAFELLSGFALDSIPPKRYVTWLRADGADLMNQLYRNAGFEVISLPCGLEQAGGYALIKPLTDPGDFKGLKVRSPGILSTQVQARLGAAPVQVSGAEILPALERGKIDATETFSFDQELGLGFHKVMKFSTNLDENAVRVMDLLINAGKWNALDPLLRVVARNVCSQQLDFSLNRILSRAAGHRELLAKHGVVVKRPPVALLASYSEVSRSVLSGESEKNPDFMRVLASYNLFRE